MKSNLRTRIQQLNRMNVGETEYSYIQSVVRNMHENLQTVTLSFRLNAPFYRVRCNPSIKPTKVTDLREPPWDRVTDYQRCNPPGKPTFYASNKRSTAALECNPAVGDILYIGEWRLIKVLNFNSTLSPSIYDKFPDVAVNIGSTNERLFDYFETIFTRPIHEKFSEQYKLTSAIAELLTSNYPKGHIEDHQISKGGHIGITYPSVIDIDSGFNVALHPEIVNDFISLNHVLEARVISRIGNDLCLEITDNSKEITNGVVSWSGDPLSYPFRKSVTKSAPEHDGINWQISISNAVGELEDA